MVGSKTLQEVNTVYKMYDSEEMYPAISLFNTYLGSLAVPKVPDPEPSQPEQKYYVH